MSVEIAVHHGVSTPLWPTLSTERQLWWLTSGLSCETDLDAVWASLSPTARKFLTLPAELTRLQLRSRRVDLHAQGTEYENRYPASHGFRFYDEVELAAVNSEQAVAAERELIAAYRGAVALVLPALCRGQPICIQLREPSSFLLVAAALSCLESGEALDGAFGYGAFSASIHIDWAIEEHDVHAFVQTLIEVVGSWPTTDRWRVTHQADTDEVCIALTASLDKTHAFKVGVTSDDDVAPDRMAGTWHWRDCAAIEPPPPYPWPQSRPLPIFRSGDRAKHSLDLLGRRHLGFPALRNAQHAVLGRTLGGHHQIVVMPTAAGKSACYQLAALIRPGLTIVISPLNSLIRDQIEGLRARGVAGVGAILSAGSSKADAHRVLMEGGFRLLYVSPERLVRDTFRRSIRRYAETQRIAHVVIDEVHVASEWGHDFRPSYLSIASFLLELRTGLDRPVARANVAEDEDLTPKPIARSVVLTGFTATASEVVRDDLCEMFGLDPKVDVYEVATPYRPELSFSVMQARTNRDKPMSVANAILHQIPSALGRTTPDSSDAGVVFCIYAASSTGSSTRGRSVVGVREALLTAVGHLAQDDVAISSSKPPPDCPCAACSGRDRRSRDCKWAELQASSQRAFKNDQIKLMVATKGFGMGVDKPDVRYVHHECLPAGVSAYYQEAGRAGRDGNLSHCSVSLTPLVPQCRAEWFDDEPWERLPEARTWTQLDKSVNESHPPCLRRGSGWSCPFPGLRDLCDVGRQARFIRDSFGTRGEHVAAIMDTHRRLERVAGADLTRPISISAAGRDADAMLEYSLFVLQRLKVIRNFVNNYSGGRRTWLAWMNEEVKSTEEVTLDAQRHVANRYRQVLRMRYRDLAALYRYAADSDTTCRQLKLLVRITSATLPDGWRCERCDRCAPDLRFDRSPQPLQGLSGQSAVVDARLNDLLRGAAKPLDDHTAAAISVLMALAAPTFELEQGTDAMESYAQLVLGRSEARLIDRPDDLVALSLRAHAGLVVPDSNRVHSQRLVVFIKMAATMKWWSGLNGLGAFIDARAPKLASGWRLIAVSELSGAQISAEEYGGNND